MSQINPLNVVKLLFDDISSKFKESSSITSNEIKLKEQLLGKYFNISFKICTHRR
jgi:hypothetical protein